MSTVTVGTTTARSASTASKALLACGVVSPLLYIASDLVAGTLYPGYSFRTQAVSELFAIGAPTSRIVVPLFTACSLLMLGFAAGVWLLSGTSRLRRAMSVMIVANGINSLVLWNFFPMHMRGVEPTFTDAMHGILAINPFVLATLVLGAVAFRNGFRAYSIATIAVLVGLATFAFTYVTRVGVNEPTPWLGLTERASIYSHQVWHMALAILLWRDRRA